MILKSTPLPSAPAAPPANIPPGYTGEVYLPGTGRKVFWTGRVAIGLRHQEPERNAAPTSSEIWLQQLLLGGLTQ